MSEEKPEAQVDAVQKLYQFVVGEMKTGNDRAGIIQKLTTGGMDATTAKEMAGAAYDQIVEKVRKEQLTATAIPAALLGGALAAVAGGGVWGAIVIFTGYEIGYVAWGMGILAGVCVVRLTGGRRGFPLQLIAVGSSVLGILIGKYLTFYSYLRQAVESEAGAEGAASVSLLSMDVVHFFIENASTVLGPIDALWVILALGTAWRIPQGSGIRVAPANPFAAT